MKNSTFTNKDLNMKKTLIAIGVLASACFAGVWPTEAPTINIYTSGVDSGYVQEIAGDSARNALKTADSIHTRQANIGALYLGTIVSGFEAGAIDTLTATDSTNTIVCQNVDGCFINITSLQRIGRVVTLTQLGGSFELGFRTTSDVYWGGNVVMSSGAMNVSCGNSTSGQPSFQSITLSYLTIGVWSMTGSVPLGGTCDP